MDFDKCHQPTPAITSPLRELGTGECVNICSIVSINYLYSYQQIISKMFYKSLVIRQKGESQKEGNKKTQHAKFSDN